ncbi:MAG: oligosaccharide flippase family protein, partial [Burkholderiaceae bacterium]|nr:oligosaccharide flippase family protein [Burkholderiaceae bacterium]
MNSKLRYLLVDIFRLSRIGFARNVAVLAGGTSLAQAIIILTSPILTRLFSPEDFGLLGVYTTVISILLVIVAWRYELAVVLPKEERTAINLLILALLIVIFMCSLVGLLLVVFGSQIVTWLDVRLLYPFLWFFPLGLLGGGVYQVLSFWAVRKGTFGTLAKTRLTQNAGQAITQILLGLLHVGPLGLVFGDVVGRMGGTATLWRQAWKQDKGLLRDVSISSLKSVAYQYRSFPILSSGSSLLNIAGLQLPML